MRGFVAEIILQVNTGMMELASRLGKVDIRTEDGMHRVTCLFEAASAINGDKPAPAARGRSAKVAIKA